MGCVGGTPAEKYEALSIEMAGDVRIGAEADVSCAARSARSGQSGFVELLEVVWAESRHAGIVYGLTKR